MSNSFTYRERNRFTKFYKGKNPPYRIMYGGKEVQFIAQGNELVNQYIDKCSARWQRAYKKLYPSEIYGNWFNYMQFNTKYSSTYRQDEYRWRSNYNYRKTIETTYETSSGLIKGVVSLLNGYNLNTVAYNPHLNIVNTNIDTGTYDKYLALKHECCDPCSQEFNTLTLDSDYTYDYRDTLQGTGYSICKEFLNSTEAFSISFAMRLITQDTHTYSSQQDWTPILMLRIYDSNYVPVKNIGTYVKYQNAYSMSSDYSYTYGDYFNHITRYNDGTGVIDPTELYTQQKLYTYITPDDTWQPVTDIHGKELSTYTTPSLQSIWVNTSICPRVHLTFTCDKQTLKLYVNGKLSSTCDVSQYLVNGNQFFDSDILFDRTMTVNSSGDITTQSPKYTPYTNLYNLHVFNECLSGEQVRHIFQESDKWLSSKFYPDYAPTERPYSITELTGPILEYEAGPNTHFELGDAYYYLTYVYYNERYQMDVTSRREAATDDIQWTFDDSTVFQTGGVTTAHARYENGDIIWTKDYTINVKPKI